MGDHAAAGRTQIIVAVITVTGTVAVGLLANWDKIFDREDRQQIAPPVQAANPVQPSVQPASGTLVLPPGSAPTAAAAATSLNDLAAALEQALSVDPASIDAAAAQLSAAAPINVAGRWKDGDGHDYVFEQKGSDYSYRQLKRGAEFGSGEGKLIGLSFMHSFTGKSGDGTCSGELSADGSIAAGTCKSGGKLWPMMVTRSTAAKS